MENRDARIADPVAGLPGAHLETVDTGGASLTCLVAGTGPVAILAHGFPDCARTFRRQIPALVAAGFRVVAPWLRGYFPSTLARDGRYDLAALGNDLVALARHFSPRDPVRLVGHDWGALAGYAAAALAPEAFAHLTTVAVPHPLAVGASFLRPAQLRRSWYIAFFQIRGSAEWVLRRDNFALIDRLWRDWSPHLAVELEELTQAKAALARLPNTRAALAYYRAVPRAAFSPSTARLLRGRTRVPSLYVHGNDDGCFGVELVNDVERAYAAPVRVARLDGGHFVHLENAERFNALLLDEWRRPRT
jgi:pimeloyl-ACP methyl ester carboxylesterase